MKPRQGYTLIEITVASALAIVVAGAMLRVFWFARGTELDVSSSYLVRQDVDVVFKVLQDDLRMSHLASIRVASDDRGFSMISPLEKRDPSTFTIGPYGVAQWKSWVYYTVMQANDPNLGDLVRWEQKVPDHTVDGIPATGDPTKPGDEKDNLMNGILLPGVGIVPGDNDRSALGATKGDDTGGLKLRFVRFEKGKEVLSDTNPVEQSDADSGDWSQGTTGLVDCTLRVGQQASESGYWSLYQLNLRVCPRN